MGDGTVQNPFTREDVLRLIEENDGRAEGLDLSEKVFEQGIDLSGLNLAGIVLVDTHLERANINNAHLEGADLRRVHLEEANLWETNLEGANLWEANLERANLAFANLEGANLLVANLKRAYLADANLKGVALREANLERANLFEANLKGAALGRAHLEGAVLVKADLEGTNLVEANLKGACLVWAQISADTEFEGVDWGNYILGEEKKEWHFFEGAEHTYRRLKQWHQEHGMYDIAGKFYYREKEANRKALKLRSKHWNDRLAAESMRALFGYGERWWNIILWIAVAIFGLAAAYYFWGSFSSSSFWDTLYYSATSFSALGYGNWAPQPTGWAKGMGAAEAIIGVFMMALLLVTFVRKWTR